MRQLHLPQKMWILLSAFLFVVLAAQAVPPKSSSVDVSYGDDNETTANNIISLKSEDNFTIERELVKDRWVTLVLPYNVSDVTNFNGIKGEALEFDDLSVKDLGNNEYKVTLHFISVDKIWANYPYLFRVLEFPDGGDVGKLTIYSGPISEKPTEDDIITRTIQTDDILVIMKGTYEGFTLNVGNDYTFFYFGYDPQAEIPYNFYTVDQGTVFINTSLCYFKYQNLNNNANSVNLSFSQDATDIKQVNTVVEKKDGKIYNLNGQQVKGNLSKGVYISNGKKFIVK